MNRRIGSRHVLLCASLVTAGAVLPVRATNLLLNPGFEYPLNAGSESSANPTDWTFTESLGEIERENFQNHTAPTATVPSPEYSVWLKSFEKGTATAFQSFSNGVQAGGTYTFSGYYYFEANWPSVSDAVVDLELTFFNGSTPLGAEATYIYANSSAQSDDAAWAAANGPTYASFVSPPTGGWTQYSVTATAPANTNTVIVSFDYDAANATSGPSLGSFADDADLEGPGVPPTIPNWNVDSSGDWNVAGNWSTFSIPNAVDAVAQFEGSITANRNVYTDIPVTVGSMVFNNANKYVIDGAGSLTLQVSTGNASITVQQGTQEINLPTTIASNTVLNVSTGATLVMADPISINSGLTLTQTGGGNVTYESTITVGSSSSIAFGNSTYAHALTLQSGASASITGDGNNVELDSLALASGTKLDLGKNETTINYVGVSPATTIGSELKTGYNGGNWSGTSGITSSAASFAQGTSVGYYDTGSSVIVRYTWIGDLNLDGTVNASDVALMGKIPTSGPMAGQIGWFDGDLNYDGKINADDWSLFAYGEAIAGGRSITTLPEPSVAGVLLIAAGVRGRRRKA